MSARRTILGAVPLVVVGMAMVFFSMKQTSLSDLFSRELTRRIATSSSQPIRFADVTSFQWDKVYLFGAYTPASAIDKALGFKWEGDRQMEDGGEGQTLIVFVKDGRVVCSVNFVRTDGDFGDFSWTNVPNGLTPSEAQFVIGPSRKMQLFGSVTTAPATRP